MIECNRALLAALGKEGEPDTLYDLPGVDQFREKLSGVERELSDEEEEFILLLSRWNRRAST